MQIVPATVIHAAQASMRKWGVPASITIAQWAVESAWGRSLPAGSNNPFGIKASSAQPYVEANTREVLHGQSVHVVARFRKFASLDEAFEAHAELLATSHYYKAAMAVRNDPDAFAKALTGVYATDPHYGDVLRSVMHNNNLRQYDNLPKGTLVSNSASPNVPVAPAPGIPSASVPAPAPATAVTHPTVSESIKVDAGSAMASILAVIEKNRQPLEKLADAAEDFVLSKVPFGSLIEVVIGPHLAAQYVDQAINAAEAAAKAGAASVASNPEVILQMAMQAFVKAEGWLSSFGAVAKIESWVMAAVAKAGLAPA